MKLTGHPDKLETLFRLYLCVLHNFFGLWAVPHAINFSVAEAVH